MNVIIWGAFDYEFVLNFATRPAIRIAQKTCSIPYPNILDPTSAGLLVMGREGRSHVHYTA